MTGKQSQMDDGGLKKKKRQHKPIIENGHIQIEKMEMNFRENGMGRVIKNKKQKQKCIYKRCNYIILGTWAQYTERKPGILKLCYQDFL